MNSHKITVEVLKRNSIQKDMLSLTVGQIINIQILDGMYRDERLSFSIEANINIQFDDNSNAPVHKSQFTATEIYVRPKETGIYKRHLCDVCHQPFKKYPYKRKPNIADVLFGQHELECELSFDSYQYRIKIKPHLPSIIHQRAKNSNIDTSSSSSERAYKTLKALQNGA
jgi:hypothetical protein